MARPGRTGRHRPAIGVEPLDSRVLLTGASALAATTDTAGPALSRRPFLFTEPDDGTGVIVRAIDSARHQIRLVICNLSDPAIGAALAAAEERGVNVRIIVDRNDEAANPAEQALLAELAAHGVKVHLSNPIFHQSFEKALVIDQRNVLIMTMCLVPVTFTETRDYGLVLSRKDIIGEVTRVFETDWSHSAPPGAPVAPVDPTPPLHVADLLWSPINSRAKLARLIQSARHSINATSEILGDPFLESDLIAAAQRGVDVRLIVPLSQRDTPNVNESSIVRLLAGGVDVHVTNGPAPSAANPYMHAKTMVVDGKRAYLGSIDLQASSTSDDRELGVLFRYPKIVAQLQHQFASDWANSQAPPPPVVRGPATVAGHVDVPLAVHYSAGNDWTANIIGMTAPATALPPGVTFAFDAKSDQGTMKGSPTKPGMYLVPITVTNNVNQTTVPVHVNVE